jgi:hypothetical protein
MTVLVYIAVSLLVACVAHWTFGARTEDAALAGVAWPAAACLFVVLGMGCVAASPVLLAMWIRSRIRDSRHERKA